MESKKDHLDKLAVMLSQLMLEGIEQALKIKDVKLSNDVDFFLVLVDNDTIACTSTIEPIDSKLLLKNVLKKFDEQFETHIH